MSKRGFTLVELLIVVAIIGVLSTLGLTTYSSVQQKARDTKRRADIDAIAKVMESKYNIKNATYPTLADSTILNAGFVNNQLPVPPKGDDYVVSSDGKGFIACSKLDTAPADLTAQQCIATYNIGINKQNCYCQKSSSGSTSNIIAAASIGNSSLNSITIDSTGTGNPVSSTSPRELVIRDDFNRPNSPSRCEDNTQGLGNASNGQLWVYEGGVAGREGRAMDWEIINNQVKHKNCGNNGIYAVVESGVSNGVIRVTFSRLVPDQGMVFRYANPSNTYKLVVDGSGYKLKKVTSGSGERVVGEIAIPNFDATYRGTSLWIEVVLNSDEIKVFINSSKGNSWTMSYTDSALKNNTKAGLMVWGDTTMSWDNFSVSAFQPIPTPTPSPTPTPTPAPTPIPTPTTCSTVPQLNDGGSITCNATNYDRSSGTRNITGISDMVFVNCPASSDWSRVNALKYGCPGSTNYRNSCESAEFGTYDSSGNNLGNTFLGSSNTCNPSHPFKEVTVRLKSP